MKTLDVLLIHQARQQEASETLKGERLPWKAWFSCWHAGISEAKSTLKMNYSSRNSLPNLGIGKVKTSLGNSAKQLRLALLIIFPNCKLFSENQTWILTEFPIASPQFL